MQSERENLSLPAYVYILLDTTDQKPIAVETTYRKARVLADKPEYDGSIVVRCIPENETALRVVARFLGSASAIMLLVALLLGCIKLSLLLYQSIT